MKSDTLRKHWQNPNSGFRKRRKYNGVDNPNYNKKWTEERRLNFSEICKESYKNGRKNSMKDKKRPDLTQRNINNKGKTYEEMFGEERAIRKRKIHSEQMMEKNNPNWKEGKSFEVYPKEFHLKKSFILKRDGNCCLLCGGEDICVHHIDGNKKNNSNNNLISVCRICHGRYVEHIEGINMFLKNCAALNEEIFKETEDIFRSMTQ